MEGTNQQSLASPITNEQLIGHSGTRSLLLPVAVQLSILSAECKELQHTHTCHCAPELAKDTVAEGHAYNCNQAFQIWRTGKMGYKKWGGISQRIAMLSAPIKPLLVTEKKQCSIHKVLTVDGKRIKVHYPGKFGPSRRLVHAYFNRYLHKFQCQNDKYLCKCNKIRTVFHIGDLSTVNKFIKFSFGKIGLTHTGKDSKKLFR